MADVAPEYTIFPSIVRNASVNSGPIEHEGSQRGVWIVINVTVQPGAESLSKIDLEVQDLESGVWSLWARYAPINAVGMHNWIIHPEAVETNLMANVIAQRLPLPRRWRLDITHSAAGNWTYDVTAQALK